jgi:rubrerythrin
MTTTTTPRPDAGQHVQDPRELFCGECGYGVVIRRDPPECPMCRSEEWTERPAPARWN